MLAKVRRWGNSLAVRLRRTELDRAGVAEGDVVRVEIVKVVKRGKVDLTDLPTFEDPDPQASVRHDTYLYG
jgi:antitoxin component of MazEF toxin-antitoxin module